MPLKLWLLFLVQIGAGIDKSAMLWSLAAVSSTLPDFSFVFVTPLWGAGESDMLSRRSLCRDVPLARILEGEIE